MPELLRTLPSPSSIFKAGVFSLLMGATYQLSRMRYNLLDTLPQTIPADEPQPGYTRRHLLEAANTTVNLSTPFPNQVVKLYDNYNFDFSSVFSGNYSLVQAYGYSDGFKPRYKLVANYPLLASELLIQGNRLYVLNGNLNILDVSNVSNIVPIGHYDSQWWSTALAVDEHKNIAYLIAGDLKVVDMSSANPQLLSTFSLASDTDNYVYSAALTLNDDRDLLFVKDAVNIDIINVSDPLNLVKKGAYTFPLRDDEFTLAGIAYANGMLYVTHFDGLYSIDVSNTEQPQLLSILYQRGYIGLTLVDSMLYLACGEEGMQIINIRNPQRPQYLSTYLFEKASIHNIEVVGQIAFVSMSYPGKWQMVDLSNPFNPRTINTFWLSAFTGGVSCVVSNNLLVVSDGINGLQFYDLRQLSLKGSVHLDDPEIETVVSIFAYDDAFTPKAINTFRLQVDVPPTYINTFRDRKITLPQSLSLAFDVSKLFSNFDAHLLSLAIHPLPAWLSIKQKFNLVGEYSTSKHSRGNRIIILNTNSAVVAYQEGGFDIIDITSLEHIQKISNSSDSVCGMERVGITLFTQLNGSIIATDVHDLLIPQIIGVYPNPSCELSGSDNTLVTADAKNVYIYDVRNPYNMTLLETLVSEQSLIRVLGNTLYLANSDGVFVWSLKNANNPQRIDAYIQSYMPKMISVFDQIILMADGLSNTLQCFNRSNLQLLSTYPAANISGISLYRNKLYLALGEKGLMVLDVSNTSQPQLCGSFPGNIYDVAVLNDHTVLAVTEQGVQALNLTSIWEMKAEPQQPDLGVYELSLKVNNEFNSELLLPFTITVEGEGTQLKPADNSNQDGNNDHNTILALECGIIALSALLCLCFIYQQRVRAFNTCVGDKKIEEIQINQEEGEPSKVVRLALQASEIDSIQLMVRQPASTRSCGFFRTPKAAAWVPIDLLKGDNLPEWLTYDLESNSLSIQNLPEQVKGQYLLRVKDKSGYIRQQVKWVANESVLVNSEEELVESGGVAMRTRGFGSTRYQVVET